MKNRIKNAFSRICVSDKLEKSILNMTVNKRVKNNKKLRLSYACLIILAICLLSISVVYAKEIKEFIQNWSILKTLSYDTYKTFILKTKLDLDLSKEKIDYSNDSIIEIIDIIKSEDKDFNMADYRMTYNVGHEETGFGHIFFTYYINGKIETNKVYMVVVDNKVVREITLAGVKNSNISKIKEVNNDLLCNKVENFEKNDKREALFKEANKIYGNRYQFSIDDVMTDNNEVNVEKFNPYTKKYKETYFYDYNTNELSYRLIMDEETDSDVIEIVIE